MSAGFCPFCGKPTLAQSSFCAHCGKPLAKSAAAPAPNAAAHVRSDATQSAAEEEVFLLKPLVVRSFFEILLCIVTVGVAWLLLWIARMGRRYRVTTQRIETRTGVFSVKRDYLDLFRVEDFEVEQPFFQRLRNAGNLKIWSADEDEPIHTLEAIPDVQAVYERLRQLTRAERSRNQVRVIEGM